MTTQEPYPYNLAPWRRSFEAASPDGRWRALISEAWEIGMSDPTAGLLRINDAIAIKGCSPTFVWSDDSRFLAVPQWHYWLRRRERLLLVDVTTSLIYASRAIYRMLILEAFKDGVLAATDSPLWKPREVRIPVEEAVTTFKKIEPDGAANRSQPVRSATNSTSSAAGSRR